MENESGEFEAGIGLERNVMMMVEVKASNVLTE